MENHRPSPAEKQRPMFADHQLDLANDGSAFVVTSNHKRIRISRQQLKYLSLLKRGYSIEQLVLDHLSRNILVQFVELDSLIKQLVVHEVILNPAWRSQYFQVPNQDWKNLAQSQGSTVTAETLNQLPFFNGMPNRILQELARSSQVYRTQGHVRLCQQGQQTRDMFALLEGSAVVQQNSAGGLKHLATLRAPTVFGEGGFFLNQARSADVITVGECQVIRIRHLDSMDQWINQDIAQALRKRIWILHALSKSFLFSKYPVEIWNDVSTLGHLRESRANEVLFREGDRGASFFTVVQGKLEILQDGKRINRMTQGSCFGEVALFLTGGRRSATVVATEASLLQEIPHREFYPFLARHLHLAAQLEVAAHHHLAEDRSRSKGEK